MFGVKRIRCVLINILLCCCVFCPSVKCFSYNVKAITSFRPGPRSNGHSYFGYSVMMRSGNPPTLFIGAPRETSEHSAYEHIKDPGTTYMCDIKYNEDNIVCQQKNFDPQGNTMNNIQYGKPYHHRKDNMWLGMTMDGSTGNNGTLVVCAPRWINQYYSHYLLGNGLCYSVANTVSRSYVPPTIIIPLIDTHRQTFQITHPDEDSDILKYFYAYGEAGMSVKLANNDRELLIGAPGVFSWTGSVIKYRVDHVHSEKDYFSKQSVPNPYYSTPILKEGAYFGYSLDSGHFISSRPVLYVAGAPRGNNYTGQVLLFDFPIRDTSSLVVIAEFTGRLMGEYFGAAILVVDINKDGLDDLIVGAPLFAKKFYSDQGRIFVYINHNKGNFFEQESLICGNCVSNARFGSSMTSIGDINNDGYTDVAIGAPYEDSERGAIYIYLGTASGLNPIHVQRIVVAGTKGFGMAISRSMDLDNNGCNEIAVGAYGSGNAFILRCHRSIEVTAKMDSYPSELSINATNVTAGICFTFHDAESAIINLKVELSVDPGFNRGNLAIDDYESFVVNNIGGNEKCFDFLINLKPLNPDFSRPFKIEMSFDLSRDPLKEKPFCVDCPVLGPHTNKEKILQIPFATGCGPDLICRPDLKLSVRVISKLPYVIGSSPSIQFNISLENNGEPAFFAKIELRVPGRALVLRVPSTCFLVDLLLTCNFDNPMAEKSQGYIILDLDTSLLTNRDEALEFNVTATSSGEEAKPDDNFISINVPLLTKANLEIFGKSPFDQYIYINRDSKKLPNITIAHAYEIQNYGPTPLEAIKMHFFIPVAFMDYSQKANTYTLMKVFEPKAMQNLKPLICNPILGEYYTETEGGKAEDVNGNLDYYNTTDVPEHLLLRKRRNIIFTSTDNPSNQNSNDQYNVENGTNYIYSNIFQNDLKTSQNNKYLNVHCGDIEHVTCMIIECKGAQVSAGGRANVVLEMKLNISNLAIILKDNKLIEIFTSAIIEPDDTALSKIEMTSVSSLIIGGKIPNTPTPIWLICLSVILGALILSLITFGLFKMDFFRRKSKENLQLLKNQEHSNIDDNIMDEIST